MIPWRPMTASDLPAILALAALVHPGFPEDAEILAEKRALHPLGCFTLDAPPGAPTALAGYLLSHPWRLGDVPKLNRRLHNLPQTPNCHYLHDLALHPTARHTGHATTILQHLFAQTPTTHALVAVNNSTKFWSRHGFRPVKGVDVESYGAGQLTCCDQDKR